MAKYFRSVLIQIEYPDGMLNANDPTPTGPGITTPLTELSKVITDGCGAEFTLESFPEKKVGYDAVFIIKEV